MTGLDESLPEHNPQAEWMLIACCIEKPEILPAVCLDHFYLAETRRVFERIIELKPHDRVNPVSVPESFFSERNLMTAVCTALNGLPSPAGWSYWLEICEDYRKARRVASIAVEMRDQTSAALRTGSPFDPTKFNREISKLSGNQSELSSIEVAAHAAFDEIQAEYENPNVLLGIRSGFEKWDRMLKGFHPGDMTIIAARPSIGKTAFALNVVQNVCMGQHIPTMVFSLEMNQAKLSKRLILSEANIDANNVVGQKLSERDIYSIGQAREKLKRSPIRIYDSVSDLADIHSTIASQAGTHGTRLVVIDYVQRIQLRSSKEGRQFQVAAISSTLKDIAMATGVSMLVLAQISRAVEKEDRIPVLSDLRDTGQLEQDADSVSFLHPREQRRAGVNIQQIDLIVQKNRSGSIGTVPLTFRFDITRFVERAAEMEASRV